MKLKIVFVPRRSRIRPYKMAKALKYTQKVELILVCEESFYDPELFKGIFDEVHFFTRKNWLFKLPKAEKIYRRLNERFGFGFKRMIKIINKIQPDIVQCYAEPYNHIVHILKNTSYPVVMTDGADFTGITEGLENIKKKTKDQERFCFENVKGIVHKGPVYEIDYYKNNGFFITAKELTWLDYCDDDLIQDVYSSKENGIHIVYTGAISTNPKEKYIYFIELANDFIKQKIHFHIYPNPYQFNNAFEYKKLAKESKYFHFHSPISYFNIAREISKYQLGLWYHDPSGGKRVYIDKQKVAIGNKFFTYLEAGLPTIVGKHNGHGRLIIEKYNLGFSTTKNEIGRIKDKINFDLNHMISGIAKNRILFLLSKKSEELLNFYMSIYDVQK